MKLPFPSFSRTSLTIILTLSALVITPCCATDDSPYAPPRVPSVTRLEENKLSVVSFKIDSTATDIFDTESVDNKYNLFRNLREVLESVLSPIDSDYHVHIGREIYTKQYNVAILLSASEEELNTLDILIGEGKFGDLGPIEGYCVDPSEYNYTGKLVVAKSTLDDFKRRDSYYFS